MNSAGYEWAARVAARNEIEVAKATRPVPLSADAKQETEGGAK